jgi:hypothetical protein
MGMEAVLGILLVAVGGLIMGAGAWPMKLMRTFQFEHWWFLAMLFGLVVGPWTVTLVYYPHIFESLHEPALQKALIAANILALCWGVANILCGLCYVRIGIALTQAILSGLGASVVVLAPMIFKGSGQFKDAPDVLSTSGGIVLLGVAVMLVAVVLASLAGFGRDRVLKKLAQTEGSFLVGLIMTVIAGITSAGLWLAFIYCQGPIQSRACIVQAGEPIELTVTADKKLCEKFAIDKFGNIMLRSVLSSISPQLEREVELINDDPAKRDDAAKKIAAAFSARFEVAANGAIELPCVGWVQVAGLSAKDAADKIAGVLELTQPESNPNVKLATLNVLSVFPVWAFGAFSGAMLNLIYPAYLMTRKRSWGVLFTNWKEFGLTVIMGVQTVLALTLPGKGMLMLGVLGAAIGGGIQQAMQMAGGQGTGFISGEWRGVYGKPRWQMFSSIALLILASFIMAYAKKF